MKRLRQSVANISIPILAKITVPYVFLAGLIALGGTFLVTRVVFDSVEERFTNQLIEAGLLASESMVRVEQDLLEDVRVLSFLGGMASAVVTCPPKPDPRTMLRIRPKETGNAPQEKILH